MEFFGSQFWLVLSVTMIFAMAVGPAFGQTDSHRSKLGIAGELAPEWKTSKWIGLPNGKTSLDIPDVKGKVTYLYFFQSWCPGCHSSGFPTLKNLRDQFRNNDNVQFVAIQTTFEGHEVNTADKLEETAKRHELSDIPFGQSAGASGTPDIMKKYRTGGTPWVVLIDKEGRVVFNDFHINETGAAKAIEELANR